MFCITYIIYISLIYITYIINVTFINIAHINFTYTIDTSSSTGVVYTKVVTQEFLYKSCYIYRSCYRKNVSQELLQEFLRRNWFLGDLLVSKRLQNSYFSSSSLSYQWIIKPARCHSFLALFELLPLNGFRKFFVPSNCGKRYKWLTATCSTKLKLQRTKLRSHFILTLHLQISSIFLCPWI